MTTVDVETLKTAHRATWAAGDYSAVAEMIDVVAPDHLVRRLGIASGQRVLDVATGTGNVAVRAAALGAETVGLDLTPELLDIAGRRADDAGVEVEWIVGDAEDLPFEDDSFDRVLSAFGIQFAPRHLATARELVRVCKPGGAIGLCNWTPDGAVAGLFGIMTRYLPAPPGYASPPPLWGSERHVRDLFAGHDVEVEFERGATPFAFESADDYVSFMETNYGPTLKARERLSSEGTWADCRAEIVEMMAGRNEAGDGGLLVPSEYVLITVHKR